jgi:hypothetical protein
MDRKRPLAETLDALHATAEARALTVEESRRLAAWSRQLKADCQREQEVFTRARAEFAEGRQEYLAKRPGGSAG